MPTIQSAEKRVRQEEKREERNKRVKSRLTTAVRRFKTALEEDDLERAEELMPVVESEYDKAASKNVIPQNRASRKIGRLKKRLHKHKNDE
jgi:small subunit ribosomal protein S20